MRNAFSNIEKKRINKKSWVSFMVTGGGIGAFTAIFIPNGPFSTLSDNYILDLIICLVILIINAFVLYLISRKFSKKLVIILFMAMGVRLLTVFVMSILGFLPYLYDGNWERAAAQLLPDWRAGHFHFDTGTEIGYYSKLTTVVYFFIGQNPIFMQLINVFFGTLTVHYIFLIGQYLFNAKVGYFSALLMAFWPTHIFFTSMQMKEALAGFFLVAICYYFIKWIQNFELKYLFITVIFFIFNILMRPQNAVLLLIIMFPFVFYSLWVNSNKNLKILLSLISFFLMFVVIGFLSVTGYLTYFNLDYIASEMNYRTDGGAAYLEWMAYNNFLEIIVYAPLRLFYFLYTPFPWQIGDLPQLFAFIESSVLLFISIYIFLNIKKITWNKALLFFVCFCLIGLTANSIIDSNVGTSMRHKLQYVYLFTILFSAIYHQKKE